MKRENKNLLLYASAMFVCFGLLTDGAALAHAHAPVAVKPDAPADYPFYLDLGDICELKVNDSMTVEQEIRVVAACHGANADRAVAIAKCESSLNPSAKNWQGSTAKGVFMFTDPTWKYIKAHGHQFDRHENIAQFFKWYPQHPEWWACTKLTK